MYASRGAGISAAVALAYTGVAVSFYILIGLSAIVAGLLLLRTSRLHASRPRTGRSR